MKKILILASTATLLFATSCKKNETVVTTDGSDTLSVVKTTETTTLANDEAKAKVDKAQADLDAAIKNGDKKAEEASRKALADANLA